MDTPTTWVLWDLWRHHTLETLHASLATIIEPQSFNFLHLPGRAPRKASYCFINFIDGEAAALAIKKLKGKRWPAIGGEEAKVIKASVARVQGLLPCVEKTVSSPSEGVMLQLYHNGQAADMEAVMQLHLSPGTRAQERVQEYHAAEAPHVLESEPEAQQPQTCTPPRPKGVPTLSLCLSKYGVPIPGSGSLCNSMGLPQPACDDMSLTVMARYSF